MKMPSTEQLNVAISWLRANEGIDGEADACEAVAAWIEHEERERLIRSKARAAGVSVARFRRRLNEIMDRR